MQHDEPYPRILVKVPVSPFGGYGMDGIGITTRLMDLGADVFLDPTSVAPPIPPEVAGLLTRTIEPPFDISIAHVDPASLVATEANRRTSKFVVGWTMWEWSNLANCSNLESMKVRLEAFDAVVAYDQVTADGLAEYYDGPIPVVQGGYDSELWQYVQRDWAAETFHYCQVGALTERKNPWALITAFRQLKDEHGDGFNAMLHLKDLSMTIHPSIQEICPAIRVYHQTWSTGEMAEFYRRMHVMVCPSRGEGKNLPALEFLTTGGAVIATNWGGHQQWLTREIAIPLEYQLVSYTRPYQTYESTKWADVDVDALKAHMWDLYVNRGRGRELGYRASQLIPKQSDWSVVLERLFRILRELPEAEDTRKFTARLKVSEED